MKVIVFGATGTIGRLAVERLLDEGHEVTAFARGPINLDTEHPDLAGYAGDVLDVEAVTDAVKGHDAVIVALGSGMSRRSRVRSQGTLNVIKAMQIHGVNRLICQSTLGAGESWSNLNMFWKRIMFGLLLKSVLKEHELQEKLVHASGLEWTIVRPSAYTDEPASDDYKVDIPAGERGLKLKISRADVAGFLARCIDGNGFTNREVGISR